MPSQLLRGSAAEVTTNLSLAFNGTVPGNPIFTSYTTEFARVGESSLASSFAAAYSNLSNAALAARVLTNLGVNATTIGSASYTALASAVETAFAAFPTARGQVALNLARLLAGLEGDVTYGAAATAWNNTTSAAFVYSANPANIVATTPAVLNAPVAQTLNLTAGIDNLVGGAANDTFNGITAAGTLGLSVFDTLDGGDGTDTLSFVQTAAETSIDITGIQGLLVRNIEVLSMTTADGSITANTTAAGISGITTVTAAANKGAITVTAGAATNVTASTSNTGDKGVTINGGKDVSVTTSGENQTGSVSVGGTTAASGAVTVSETLAAKNDANFTNGTISVTGGTTITVAQAVSGTAKTTKGDTNFTVTQGAVTVTGNASTTAVTVTQSSATSVQPGQDLDGDGVGDFGRIGRATGTVIVTDGNAASAADTITAVTLSNYNGATIKSDVLANLTLGGGAGNTVVAATADTRPAAAAGLNLALTGSVTNLNLSGAAKYASLDIKGNAVLGATIGTLTLADDTTAVTFSGANTVGVTTMSANKVASYSVTGAGGVTLSTALPAAVKFTGGAGADSVALSNGFTAAISMGAGSDTVTYGGPAGDGGSVDAGDGVDIIVMSAQAAADASATKVFNSTFKNFEFLSLSSAMAGQTITLPGLNGVSTVSASGTGTLAGLANNGLVNLGNGANITVEVRDAKFSDADTLNLAIRSVSASSATVTAEGVESFVVRVLDRGPVSLGENAAAVRHSISLTSADATTITLIGNNGVAVTGNGAKVTTFDATGIVGNTGRPVSDLGAATIDTAANLAVSFTSANNTTTATVNITGGAGNDSLTGGAAKDVIVGGAGADVLNGGNSADTLTGGVDGDTFVFATGGSNFDAFDTVTDFGTGDFIKWDGGETSLRAPVDGSSTAAKIGANGVATFDTVVATRTDTLGGKVAAVNAAIGPNGQSAFFSHDGKTYLFINTDSATTNTTDGIVIQLVGVALPAETAVIGTGATGLSGFGG